MNLLQLQFSKTKLYFLLLFVVLLIFSGRINWEVKPEYNTKLVAFYFILVIIFILSRSSGKRYRFLAEYKSSKILFSLFLLSLIVISLMRDGLFSTYSIQIVITFICLLVFLQFLYQIKIEQALNLFLKAMFIVMLTNLFFHYQEKAFVILPQERTMEVRLTGVFGGGLAGILAGISAILPLIIIKIFGNKHKLFYAINILLAWLTMLMGDNRTAMIACLIVYFFIFLKNTRNNTKTRAILVGFIITIYFSLNFYLSNAVGGKDITTDADFREFIWSFGIDQINKTPMLGQGKANPFSENFSAQKEITYNIADPHNSYLFYILKNGILVSIFFFSFLFSFLFSSYKRTRKTNYLLLLLIPLYWIICGTSGGDYFNFTLNFSSIIFGISVFGFLNHPDIRSIRAKF